MIRKIALLFVIFGLLGVVCNVFLQGSTSVFSPKKEYDFSNVSIACLGDSITMTTKIKKSYPSCLGDALGTSHVYNYGISWSTVATIDPCHCHPNGEYSHYPYVERYNDLVSADIIIVMGGINDYGCLVPLGSPSDSSSDTFWGALNITMEGLKKTYPDAYIVFMTGFDYYGEGAHNSDGVYWKDYNTAIRRACINHNIDCLDIYSKIAFDRAKYTVDGIHPTQQFIDEIWVPRIADFIRSNYKR